MKRVVLVGDSISQCYQPYVIGELDGVAEVLGCHDWHIPPGHCTHVVLDRLDEWVIARQPDVVHINTGLHDVWRSVADGRLVHSFEKYVTEVRQILETLRRKSAAKIIWATTTPVFEQDQLDDSPNRIAIRHDKDIRRFNDASKEVAGELGVPVNDLYEIVEREGRRRFVMKEDGVHITDDGNRVLGRAVANVIKDVLLRPVCVTGTE